MLLAISSIFVLFLITNYVDGDPNLQEEILSQIGKENGTVLSRKRRFLTFPAGSSFQLVFCGTYTSVAVGSYFIFGHTAALAWELPSTPLFFDQKDFQKKEEEDNAETTTTEMPHDVDFSELDHDNPDRIDDNFNFWKPSFNEQNQQTYNVYYNNPFMNFGKNPAYFASNSLRTNGGNFGKYSSEYHIGNQRKNNNFQRYSPTRSHMRLDMDPKYYQTHRRTRRELYRKIENFLTTLNLDGKSCLLKAICEWSQSSHEKGTFIEELFKAIFRAKPHDNYKDEDHYDAAASSVHNCTEMYGACPGSTRNLQLLTRK